MAKRRAISLRIKISFVTTITVVVVAVMLGGLNTYNQLSHIRKLEQRFLHDSIRSAAAISYTIMPLLVSENFVTMNNLVSYYARRSDRLYIVVVDNNNRIMADSRSGQIGGRFVPPTPYSTEKAGGGTVSRFTRSGGEAVEVSYPVMAGDLTVGKVVMGLNMGLMQEEAGILKDTMVFSTGIALAVIFMGILLASALAKRVSRPIRLLTQAAEKVGRGDYSQRINVRSSDEVGTLAEAFDTMVGQLKNARAQLIEKDYLDSILGTMRDMLIVADPEGRIEMVNEATLTLLGYEEEELVTRPLETIVDWTQSRKGSMEDLIRRGLAGDAEMSLLSKDGREIPVLLSGALMSSDGGGARIVCVAKDISERKRAEEALQASEARLKEAQHIAHIGDWEWDIATGRMQWSEELFRIYGYRPDEITTDYGFLVGAMHPKSRDTFVGSVEAALKAGLPFKTDYTFFRRDGSEAVLHAIGQVIYDDGGAPTRMVGTVQDITERKNLRDRLEEKTAQQNTILENVGAGIAFLKDRRFIWFNARAEKMFGYSKAEMTGLTTEAFYPSSDSYEQLGKEAYPLLAAGKSYAAEQLMKRKDGSLFWCSLSGTAVDPAAPGKGSIWILQDITERRHAEEQLKASLTEKEILLKEIHHRVKNNLQVVASMLSLQSRYLEDRKAKAMFEDSRRRVESMSLIHERLYRSKDLAKIDFREYVGDLVRNVTVLNAGGAGRVEIGQEVGEVMLDVNKGIPCGLIINELLSNALRHAFPGGRTGKIEVNMQGDGDGRIALTVRDDGMGFPGDVDFRNTKSLGMQLVISLVGQLDGTIEMDGSGGTAFTVKFGS